MVVSSRGLVDTANIGSGGGLSRAAVRFPRDCHGSPSTSSPDPRFAEIESHRPYLVRYALSQLRDGQLAEEAVQEALLAALESIGSFGGKSSLRTWLTSILRFKVIDLQRRAIAERTHIAHDEERVARTRAGWTNSSIPRATGARRRRPGAIPRPPSSSAASGRPSSAASTSCPQAGSRVFFKREVLGEETETICKAEGITPSNCWVILHRSRIALRACLEKNWFGKEASNG